MDPCENFYEHACGGWIARAEIPSYMSSYDRSFTAAQVETRRRLRELYTADYPATSAFHDLHSFYSACMNTTAIDALGAAPARLESPPRVAQARVAAGSGTVGIHRRRTPSRARPI